MYPESGYICTIKIDITQIQAQSFQPLQSKRAVHKTTLGWRRERDLRRCAAPSPFRETRRVRIPLSTKKPCISRAYMAEREGFEPSRRYYRPTGIRSQTLQPLGYLSTASVILTHSQIIDKSAFYERLFLLLFRFRTSPSSTISKMTVPANTVVRFVTYRYDGSQPFSMSSPA